MKKTIVKYFLLLSFLCFSGLVSAYSISSNTDLSLSSINKQVDAFENNSIIIFQEHKITNSFLVEFLKIRTAEIEIVEGVNCYSKKQVQNYALISFSIALSKPFHVYKKDLALNKALPILIPSKRYIIFQVFRI